MSWLFTWWVWFAAALVLAILETLAPVFIFLGFAAGAAAIGLLSLIGVGFGGSVAWMLVVFMVISLISTLVLRQILGTRKDEVKTFTDDINS